MVAERVKRSEPCAHEDCGSRRFYVEDDGFTYCDQGHQQSERGTVVTNDTGELVIPGRKSKRRDADAESIATSRSGFSKPQAYEHYLLCLQLILRKQLAWLINEKSFPAELELVVKDLWALSIRNFHAGAKVEVDQDDTARSNMFSSQSEYAISTDAEGQRPPDSEMHGRRRRSKDKATSSFNVLDIVALLHTGMILLHLPVTTADLCQWIRDGQLLYYYSSKAAPVDLRRRLPAYLQRQLDPESVLKAQDLQLAVSETISSLSECHGMHCPAINHTLILYRWLKFLALPLEVFAAVRRMSELLEIDFRHDYTSYRSFYKMPELRLMAIVVVATKLLYPVDGVEQRSRSMDDLSALSIDWASWTTATDQPIETDDLIYQDAFTTTERDCLAMGDEKLDQYLDWYQDNIASEYVVRHGPAARDADFRRAMLDMFPIGIVTSRDHTIKDDHKEIKIGERLHQSQSKLTSRSAAHDLDEAVHPVGSLYRRYRRTEDVLSQPQPVQKLYELAAQRSGVSLKLLVQAVFFVEMNLEKQEIARAKRSTKDGTQA